MPEPRTLEDEYTDHFDYYEVVMGRCTMPGCKWEIALDWNDLDPTEIHGAREKYMAHWATTHSESALSEEELHEIEMRSTPGPGGIETGDPVVNVMVEKLTRDVQRLVDEVRRLRAEVQR
jgi:hypothetical protein